MSRACDELRELLPGYALGAVEPDERRAVEGHLETGCAACAAELRAWGDQVAGLAAALEPVVPAATTRARVLRAARPRRGGRRLWSALAASLLLVAGLAGLARLRALGAEVARLEAARGEYRERLASAQNELARTRAELGRLRLAARIAGSPGGRAVALAGLEAAPRASARALVDPATGRAVMFASGLAPAPAGRTYQLWAIVDGQPASAGVFDVDEHGTATLVVERIAPPERIDNWAVTEEPAGGVPQPTGAMVLLG